MEIFNVLFRIIYDWYLKDFEILKNSFTKLILSLANLFQQVTLQIFYNIEKSIVIEVMNKLIFFRQLMWRANWALYSKFSPL